MRSRCPNGHPVEDAEPCAVCGARAPVPAPTIRTVAGRPAPTTTPPTPSGPICPQCSTENLTDSLHCAACGYDFSTANPPDASPEAAAARGNR